MRSKMTFFPMKIGILKQVNFMDPMMDENTDNSQEDIIHFP